MKRVVAKSAAKPEVVDHTLDKSDSISVQYNTMENFMWEGIWTVFIWASVWKVQVGRTQATQTSARAGPKAMGSLRSLITPDLHPYQWVINLESVFSSHIQSVRFRDLWSLAPKDKFHQALGFGSFVTFWLLPPSNAPIDKIRSMNRFYFQKYEIRTKGSNLLEPVCPILTGFNKTKISITEKYMSYFGW